MRKDVKLGLAVGGVLLAVLVVYVLVVPGGNANQVGATLENLDGSEAQTGAVVGDSLAQSETKNPSDPSGNSTDDQQTGSDSGGATADAGAAKGASDASGAAADADGATAKDNASAGGGWNWDALVNGTEKLPSMGAGIDVSTNGAMPTNGHPLGSPAVANGTTANGTSANGSAANRVAVNGDATGNETANQTGTAANGGATPQDGGGDPSNGTAGAAQRLPTQQGGPGDAPVPTRETAAAPLRTTTDATRTHIVKAGDTYSKISLAVYGTSKHYAEIEHANPGIDPTRLKPGTVINVPAITVKRPVPTPAANGAQATINPQKQYRVQPNDSLYTISLRLYGKADRTEEIYEKNKALIGDDMARVKVGTVLDLPEPPTQSTAAAVAR